jgi:hypothetical protein
VGNVIPLADRASDSIVVDRTRPIVSKFWVSIAGTPAALPGVQYVRDATSYYFSFNVTDNGSGLSAFTYTDGSPVTPVPWFDMAIPSQTISSYTVSDLNCKLLSSGLYLVTGKLTTGTTNGVRSITVRVRDKVLQESASIANDETGNRIVFDNMPPAIDSVTVKNPGTGIVTTTPAGRIYVNKTSETISFVSHDDTSAAASSAASRIMTSRVRQERLPPARATRPSASTPKIRVRRLRNTRSSSTAATERN